MNQTLKIVFLWCIGSLLIADEAAIVIGESQLLTGNKYYTKPEWSPDGKYISLSTNNYAGIYLWEASTGKLVVVTKELSAGYWKEWSPDSKYISTIVSFYENKRRSNAIRIWNVDNQQHKIIKDFTIGRLPILKWVSEKTVLLLTQEEQNFYNTDTHQLTSNPIQRINPTHYFIGKDIYYFLHDQNTPLVISSQSGEKIDLTASPNREFICYEVLGGNLWISNSDGSAQTDLGVGSHPSWGPGSDKIVYMVTEDDGYTITSSELYVVNRDGSGRINITNTEDRIEMHPNWSPDGKQIIYNTYDDGHIYSIEVK